MIYFLAFLIGAVATNVATAMFRQYAPEYYMRAVISMMGVGWVAANVRKTPVCIYAPEHRQWVRIAMCGDCETLHTDPVTVDDGKSAGAQVVSFPTEKK